MPLSKCPCGAPAQGAPSEYPDVCSQWPLCERRTPRPKVGDHVTIGKAKAVWRVDHADAGGADLYRVGESGKLSRRYVTFDRVSLTVVGQHLPRTIALGPNCEACGCYRMVAS